MGFQYTICFISFFSDRYEDFGVHTNEGFEFKKPEIPEKYKKYMNGRYNSLDFDFFENAIENYDKDMIFLTEQFLELLPNIDEFLQNNMEKIDNIQDAKEYYQNIKDLILYLIEETEYDWYFTFSY